MLYSKDKADVNENSLFKIKKLKKKKTTSERDRKLQFLDLEAWINKS